MVSLEHNIPIYLKKNGRTERFQTIGHVKVVCDSKEGDLVASAVMQYTEQFDKSLTEEFKDKYIFIGETAEPGSVPSSHSRPSEPRSSEPAQNEGYDWSYKTGPTYIMTHGNHYICPMCWDGNFGVNAGTHKELTDAEVGWCTKKTMYFALCREHQQNYGKEVGNRTFFKDDGLFNKLKSIKNDIEESGNYSLFEKKKD